MKAMDGPGVLLARNTVRNIHAILRAMLKAAVDDGVLLSNPAEKLGRQLRLVMSKATRQEEIEAMSREQRQLFLDTAAHVESRYFPLFLTLAETGMRLGEAIGWEWPLVDVESREIRVAKAVSGGEVSTPKSGHGRTVDMSSALAATLARLRIDRKAETLRHGWAEMPSWVFCTKVGTRSDESKIRKVMARILKHANLPSHFTPHCLRHTYASLMLQQGEPVTYVQRQLGHASIQLTVDTYGKWLPMGNKAAVDRLDGGASEPNGSKLVATGGIHGKDSSNSLKVWSRRPGLNRRPAVYESGKIVSAVCHGPAGLLEVKLSNGDHLIKGKDITGFSWKEEVIAKRDPAVPFSLEEELQKRGGKYGKALVPFTSHIVEDGRLITGQNPGSAAAVGKAVVAKLQGG
jgi:integrase